MSRQTISTGAVPNDGTGDTLPQGASKINQNFAEIYSTFGNGTSLTGFQGATGAQGLTGSQGFLGPQGSQGFGPQGSQGIAGLQGPNYWLFENVGIHTLSNVGIGTTNPTSKLTVSGDVKVIGIITATTYSGSGSGLTNIPSDQLLGALPAIDGSALIGIVGSGSGVIIQENGSPVGTAGTINFGTNLDVSFVGGVATIDATGGEVSQFVTTSAGIHTLSNVGIGTTNPTSKLTVSGDVLVSNKIVAGLTSSIIPFYWENFSDLPSFSAYHGAFAHVHQTGKAYYAHTRWVELVHTEASGVVGTGTESYNVGIITATTFSGSGSGLTNIPSDQLLGALPAIDGSALTNIPASSITFTISASDSNNYTFSGPGIVSGNTLDPVLYLYKGFTYTFINTTGASHPFAIRVNSGGSSYTPGVSGSTTGTQTFIVPMNAPSTLYYQCTQHVGMGNTINII